MNSLFLLSNSDTSPLYFDIHWGTNIGSKAGKNNVDWQLEMAEREEFLQFPIEKLQLFP